MPAGSTAVRVAVAMVVLPFVLATQSSGAVTASACPASQSWVTNPNPPQEIPNGGQNFCDFYQFAWQRFLWLVSPSSPAPDADRNFEVQANFPELQASGTDSCTATSGKPVLFVRTLKSDDPNQPFVVPESIGQAGGGATIYDKNRNVVYYQVRFSRNLCPPPTSGNLPAGTTEIKTSWRVLDSSEAASYFTNEVVIEGVSTKPILIGLIGFHLFRTTAQHPEGVWMTWEHDGNDPDCLDPQTVATRGWSFASAACAQCLVTSSTGPLGCPTCNFNGAQPSSSLTGPPSQICRVYHDGSGPNDNKVAENIADVDGLNAQLVGPAGFVSQLPPTNPLAVFANYFNVGGLWVSDPTQPADSANQRGSLQNANTTMETTFQGDFQATGSGVVRTPALNCFGCHQYTPGSTATSGLSHTVDDLDGKPGPPKKPGGAKPGGGGPVEPVPSHRPYGGGDRR